MTNGGPGRAATERRSYVSLMLTTASGLLLGFVALWESFLFPPNSDVCFLVAVERDVRLGISLRGWSLPPPLFLFPDVVIGYPWATLFRSNPLFYFGCYAATLQLLSGVFLWRIAGRLAPDRRARLDLIFAGMILAVGVLLPLSHAYSVAVIHWPFSHYGTIFNGLIMVLLTLPQLHGRPSFAGSALLWLGYLTLIASDLLALEEIAAPLLATVFLLAAARVVAWRIVILHIAAFALAVPAYFGLKAVIRSYGLLIPAAADFTFRPGEFIHYLAATWRAFRPVVEDSWSLVLVAIAWAVVSFAMAWANLRRVSRWFAGVDEAPRREVELLFVLVFGVAAFLSALIFPIAFGKATALGEMRYFLPVYLWPPLILTLLFAAFWRNLPCRAVKTIQITAAICCVAPVIVFKLVAPEPRSSDAGFEAIDAACVRHDARYGYGNYWQSKTTTAFSGAGVCVQELCAEFQPNVWISNRNWYANPDGGFGPTEFPDYRFALTSRNLTRDAAVRLFGNPAAEEQLDDTRILFYDRPEDFAFRNYLRSPAAAMLQRRVMTSVVSPASLMRFAEYVDGNSPAVVPGAALEVKFDPPADGNVLEMTCDPKASLLLTAFDAEGRVLHRVESAPAARPNAVRRFILLPEVDGPKGTAAAIGRLIVESTGSSQEKALIAYLAVYPDARRPMSRSERD